MPLPALLTIQSGINQLRYATLKGIMAAKKKEIRRVSPAALPAAAARQKIVGLYVPEKGKKTQIIGGSPAEAAKELVRRLARKRDDEPRRARKHRRSLCCDLCIVAVPVVRMILVVAEQRGGTLNRATWETIAAAQQMSRGTGIAVAVLGAGVSAVAA